VKYFLDTNICIYFLNGTREKLREALMSKNPQDILIPSIVKAELLYGAQKSAKRIENLEKVTRFLFPLQTAGFNDEEAVVYAEIRAELEAMGKPIGPNDLIIAATVKVRGGTLVTHNVGEFCRVNGLSVEDWTI